MRKSIGIIILLILTMSAFVMAPENSRAGEGPIELTYANFTPPSTFICIQMERWKKEVEKRTGGKVLIKTFPGGTLLGAKNMMDGVIAGQADIGNLCMAYQPGRFVLTNALGLPFDFPNAEVASLVLWDLFNKYQGTVDKSFDKVKVLTLFSNAPANLMTTFPCQKIEDLKGKAVRASGMAGRVVNAWGGNFVGMPASGVPEALQKGVIKGNYSSLDTMLDLRNAEYCKFVTMTQRVVYPFAVVMNKAKWNSLPADVKKVMDDMALEQCRWTGQYMDSHVKKAMKWSVEDQGVKVFQLTPEQHAAWDELLKPIFADWKKDVEGKGLPVEEVLAFIKTSIKKHTKK